MKENGFYIKTCWAKDAADIQWFLKQKRYALNPRLTETEQIRPGVWDRVHKDEVGKMYREAAAKSQASFDRLQQKYEYLGKLNIKYLESLPKEEALNLLRQRGTRALRWHERLPLGMEPQYVCNYFNISLTYSSWRGTTQHYEAFSPNERPKASSSKAPKGGWPKMNQRIKH